MRKQHTKQSNSIQVLSDFWELTKPGVTFMVVISTFGGFYLACKSNIHAALLVNTIIGSWFVAAGTNALNQLIERNLDAKMKRTQNRPLPAGRLPATQVQWYAISISLIGILFLWLTVNWLTSLLATITLMSYIFIYTPLKRKTYWSTLIGAVPGALPAMGGWTAVTGNITLETWILFSILFFWQIPHFLAIAWIYREDYARGGFPVLPVVDKRGIKTSYHVLTTCVALLSVSLLPTLMGLTGVTYLSGASILGITFLVFGIKLTQHKTNRSAKRLLHASIIYLPLLMFLMLADKL